MKSCIRAVLAVLLFTMLAAPVTAGTLKLEIRNGRVTLEARDVPVREILAEWARIGRTRIENREQVGGAPVTLTLLDVPERDALETLLRSVSGYIAAPRETPTSDGSIFALVYVLATARPLTQQGGGLGQSQQQPLRGRGQTSPPNVNIRPNPADDLPDEAMPPMMRPGLTIEQQAPYPGYPGAMQVPAPLTPGMMVAPNQAGQGNQVLPYTGLPGQSTAPGLPGGATSVPGVVPATPSTPPKPIKPPGGPVEAP